MNYVLHKNEERGKGEYGWLRTRYSFSFADWYEPTRMGFGALRVLNDDEIAPGAGFPKHRHDNMEIITIVMRGAIAHADSEGGEGIVSAGDVQVMSAGTGVYHSEFNASKNDPLSLFQIWIEPNVHDVPPRYDQKKFNAPRKNTLQLLVGAKKDNTPLFMYQDARIYRGTLDAGNETTHTVSGLPYGIYIFVISGTLSVSDIVFTARDALGITDASTITISALENAEFLLFEVPV